MFLQWSSSWTNLSLRFGLFLVEKKEAQTVQGALSRMNSYFGCCSMNHDVLGIDRTVAVVVGLKKRSYCMGVEETISDDDQ